MLEFNGKVYARVSEIIRPFVNFDGISEEVLNRKAAIGTRVHKAIQQEIEGDLIAVGSQEQGYIQSFDKWRAAVLPTFIKSEMRCYCDEKMLTGCIDALIKLEGEEKGVIVDWKTSAIESPISWPMQAHLYAYLLKSAGFEIAPRFLFVKLDRYGRLPKVFQYKFDSNLFSRCLQAIDAFWANIKS